MKRTTRYVLGTAAVLCLAAVSTPAAAEEPASTGRPVVSAERYAPADSGERALTYDEGLVPVGARVKVVSVPTSDGGTVTTLNVAGLVPDREYGAHVHVSPCGPKGDDAGVHFQHAPDPQQPSTDPAYANPRNEIWLDFVTDPHGTGHAVSRVPWQFGERRGSSVVIHDHHTHTAPGEAGDAGDRLACSTVEF